MPSPMTTPAIVTTATEEKATEVKLELASGEVAGAKSDPTDLVPSSWNLTEQEDGSLVGVNRHTGRRFEGSHADFNEMLKG